MCAIGVCPDALHAPRRVGFARTRPGRAPLSRCNLRATVGGSAVRSRHFRRFGEPFPALPAAASSELPPSDGCRRRCRCARPPRATVQAMAASPVAETLRGPSAPPGFQGRNRLGPAGPRRPSAPPPRFRKSSRNRGRGVLACLSQQSPKSQDPRFSHGRAPHHASPSSTHDGTPPRPTSGARRAVGIATAVAPVIARAAVAASGDIVVLPGVQPRPASRGLPQPDAALAAFPWVVGGMMPPAGRLSVRRSSRTGGTSGIRTGRREK